MFKKCDFEAVKLIKNVLLGTWGLLLVYHTSTKLKINFVLADRLLLIKCYDNKMVKWWLTKKIKINKDSKVLRLSNDPIFEWNNTVD